MSAALEPRLPLVPDSTLVDRLAQRDSTALIELERRHHGSLYAQVYGVLMDSTLAERVVRDVFARAWFAGAELAHKRSAWAWLRDTAAQLAREARDNGGKQMRRTLILVAALCVPTLGMAQQPAHPNEHASATAKARVAANIARHATHVRGEAVTPATPAIPATRAVRAVPNPDGGPATRAIRAVPATPAVPASRSHRPTNPGAGHGRRP